MAASDPDEMTDATSHDVFLANGHYAEAQAAGEGCDPGNGRPVPYAAVPVPSVPFRAVPAGVYLAQPAPDGDVLFPSVPVHVYPAPDHAVDTVPALPSLSRVYPAPPSASDADPVQLELCGAYLSLPYPVPAGFEPAPAVKL